METPLQRLDRAQWLTTQLGGGESVSQSPLNYQVFFVSLDQNPPFRQRSKAGSRTGLGEDRGPVFSFSCLAGGKLFRSPKPRSQAA